MNALAIEAAVKMIGVHGPSRVLISKSGEAVRSDDPRAGKNPLAVIFIRDDGWSLGASRKLAVSAFQLWPWIAWVRVDRTNEPQPISTFKPEEYQP